MFNTISNGLCYFPTGTGFLRGRCEPREKKKKCPPGSVEVSASNKPVAEMSQEKSSDESAIDEQLCCLKENWQNKDNYKTEGHSQFVPPVIKKEKSKLVYVIYICKT